MYCKFCGKETQNQNGVCDECFAKQNDTATKKGEILTDEKQEYKVMSGFGKALTSTLMSIFSYFFSYFSFVMVVLGTVPTKVGTNLLSVGIVLLLMSIPMTVISLIFGINSISLFKKAKKAGGKKPIPALVLGINGVVWSGLSFIILFCYFVSIIAITLT